MRAFIRLRQLLASHAELARKLAALEKNCVVQFKAVFDAIHQLMAPEKPSKKPRIGFLNREQGESEFEVNALDEGASSTMSS